MIGPDCPFCGTPTEADEVDVGVGTMRVGRYGCPSCWAVQHEPADPLSPEPPPPGSKDGFIPGRLAADGTSLAD